MRWNGWGDPGRATSLPGEVNALLRDLLGVRPPAAPPAALADLSLPPSRLPGPALAALEDIVGAAHVRTDAESRVRHTGGRSTPDLLRLRAGEVAAAPDAGVLPDNHEEVLAVLRACAAHGLAVVPFGGGTSVVGGLSPEAGTAPVIALDLRRMDRLLSVDPLSRTAVLEPGVRGPRAEELLAAHGFTLGHFPQSFEWATLGGFAAARSSGQASAGFGRFEEMVMALRLAAPAGTLTLGTAPRSAAGPDLRQLVLGSEGAFGVITSLTLRLRPRPEIRVHDAWRLPGFAAGQDALRRLAQDGPLPTVLRLSDESETLVGLADPSALGTGEGEDGCLVIAGYEGTASDVDHRRHAAGTVLRQAGGQPLDEAVGEGWERGRYAAPYLRDALLDAGAFVETLETAGFWSALPGLYEGVRTALTRTLTAAGSPPLVLCHISHVYPAGASLYFTVAAAQGPGDGGGHWTAAKHAANDAILAAGGTISHHHGVGTDHRDWYAREIGPLGAGVLRAVKDHLDPAGILNPGVLLPPPAP
ncbi:FAD-binding oxidoreductase [Streptomyces sp. DSM 44917]|uniref:FAD-binding oxidoreductase n=1 Tax=Streptomyces boetiae TaxID=3075541 RepID=A0ABU2LH23_9ACTN|nr:FAD-binding oxidoreductase [Streptomyces sp. DSM 44917]MDT0310552.1 FAD-binding oxidoreductase [Streptomyces sp. DSM 44917]